MQVIKRDGSRERISFDKISLRIAYLIEGVDYDERIGDALMIDSLIIAKDVCSQVTDGITTSQLDEYAAEIAAYKVSEHPDYDALAARIIISNNHKNSKHYSKFSDMMHLMHNTNNTKSESFMRYVDEHKDVLDEVVDKSHVLDFKYLKYFGYKTLERSYLEKATVNNTIIYERPQHMWMRVALDLNRYDIKKTLLCYEAFSHFLATQASPTLFNAGGKYNQFSSCFLMTLGDSVESMYSTLQRCSDISKWAGGIGISLSGIRSARSKIRTTGGTSSGTKTLLKVYNEFARHINQGGRRKGSIAFYLECFHADIWDFLELKKIIGKEEDRARDLFYALYISDIFMQRVETARNNPDKEVMWSLMCPDECPGLTDVYGDAFEALYTKYEQEGKYREQINILKLWDHILDSQLESSMPYMVYKDAVNKKSNQKNIGVIKCSNLCSEVIQYSSPDEISVCNLASIVLHSFVNDMGYNYNELAKVTGVLVENINNVINQNYYTCLETMKSNIKHRPMAIGVQGLAETFFKLRLPYESDGAMKINREIFETIQYAAWKKSCDIAQERRNILLGALKNKTQDDINKIKQSSAKLMTIHFRLHKWKESTHANATPGELIDHQDDIDGWDHHLKYITEQLTGCNIRDWIINGLVHIFELQFLPLDIEDTRLGSYSTFIGSPSSQGIFQHMMWPNSKTSGLWDKSESENSWNALGYDIQKFGVANSLLTSCMPTASTAQIMGSTESFEPITSNIYTRSVLAGSFMVVNKYLQQDLLTLGIWNNDMKDKIIEQRGSLNNIDEIPDELKQLYKTTWDISNKKYIDMSKERAWFIDQTQSFNLFIAEPTYKNLTQCHMHGWKSGLKTGMYYLRRKPASDAIQFTIDKQKEQNTTSSVALEDRLHDNLEKAVNGEEIFTGSCTGGACGA